MIIGQTPVSDAIAKMGALVKKGDLAQAKCVGDASVVPLSLANGAVAELEDLCQGGEGRIFRGLLDEKSVAVKKPMIRNTMDLERFRQEVQILSSLDHKHIVPVLGARFLPPNYFMVMPNLGESLFVSIHEKSLRPNWATALDMGIQLASAIHEVHSAGIVHRDVKSKNVMLGNGEDVYLIDFGVACFLSEVKAEEAEPQKEMFSRGKPTGGFHKRRMVGTLEYMAPEILKKEPCSYASDVYAFAVTLNELITGVYPFSDCTKDNPDCHTVLEMGYGRQELAAAVAAEGLRPTLPKNAPFGYSEFMNRCWDLNPGSRPTVSDVLKQLLELKQTLLVDSAQARCGTHESEKVYRSNEVGVMDSTIGVNLLKGASTPHSWKIPSKEMVGEQDAIVNCTSYEPVVGAGGFASAGRRGQDKMEDRMLISESFMGQSKGALFGVYDGHRGFETAQFAVDALPGLLAEGLKAVSDPQVALRQAYLQLEQQFESTSLWRVPDPKGARFPGCTALTALVWWDKLFLANAGDCRAVMCHKGEAVQLTRDHTAMDALERERVTNSGGRVEWKLDSWRIGAAGLQVTRSLGDVDMKSEGVTADPEITRVDLTPADDFLILATDGLWDALSNEEAVHMIQDTVKHPDMCSKRLVTEAIARGSPDNVCAIVVFLKPVSTIERVYHKGSNKYGRCSKRPIVAHGNQVQSGMVADELIDLY